jgi:phosphatidate cytidylyltransferase
LFTADRHEGPNFLTHFREMMASFFGMVYLAFLPLYLVLLRDAARGPEWVVLLFLIVWASDTGAYFVGLKFGRRKLYAAISPKKTIEGLLGGVATAALVTFVYKLTVLPELSWVGAALIATLVALAGAVGDLSESFLKRAFETKDSGSILPGHGGFLDRFDGVLFGLPVMYACVRIFN